MNASNSKFHTIRVTPTCHTSAVDDGEILFIGTEIPNAVPKNGTAMLKQIVCHNQDDHAADIELAFFANNPSTEALGATAVNFLAGYNTGGNATDAEVENACPLGSILLDRTGGVAGTATSGSVVSGEYVEARNYTDNMMFYQRNINMPVWSGVLTNQEAVLEGRNRPSSIYVMGIATATHTWTASGLIFYFTFEW